MLLPLALALAARRFYPRAIAWPRKLKDVTSVSYTHLKSPARGWLFPRKEAESFQIFLSRGLNVPTGKLDVYKRQAVGVSALPLNVAVEISMVVEVRD